MIPIILKDAIPRPLAYPIGEGFLCERLADEFPLEDLGMFFLFTSGIQLDHYDPLTSTETSYPVLALDREPPPLVVYAEARLRDAQRQKAERAGTAGTSRVIGGVQVMDRSEQEEQELEIPFEVAVLVFPVKARMRRRITDAIEDQGIQLMRNWLAASGESAVDQKPLVLFFDENTGRVTARFAKQEGPRRLYR